MSEWIGRYRILRPLGEGGMGRTFLGEAAGASGFSRRVVLKLVKDELDPGLKQALLDEARLVASLVHRNIVPVLDLEESGERRLVVLEHVDGMDLRHLIERRARLPWRLALFVASEVAAGLDYAHRKSDAAGRALSIVHRDVSPQNVLLSWEGEVKLTDFGVAKFARSGESFVGSIKGNPGYMAPEQARGEPIDARADLFALGVALREMVTGSSAASPLDGDVPRALAQVIERATAEEARLRFATAAAMREALLAIPGQPADPARQLAAFLQESRAERRLAPDALLEAVLGGGRPMTQVKPADTVAEPPRAPPLARRSPRRALMLAGATLISLVLALAIGWTLRRPPAPTVGSPPAGAAPAAAPSPPVGAAPAAAPSPPVGAAPAAAPSAPVGAASPAVTPAAARKPDADKPRARRGTLSINSIPWSKIFLDGNSLGPTPRVNLSVEPGRHHLRLVTRGGDVRHRTIDVPPGRDVKVTVDFARP